MKRSKAQGTRSRAERFRKLVEFQRSSVDEVLQLYGDLPDCSRQAAIELDWIHCLHTGVNDVLEDVRNTNPDDEAFR